MFGKPVIAVFSKTVFATTGNSKTDSYYRRILITRIPIAWIISPKMLTLHQKSLTQYPVTEFLWWWNRFFQSKNIDIIMNQFEEYRSWSLLLLRYLKRIVVWSWLRWMKGCEKFWTPKFNNKSWTTNRRRISDYQILRKMFDKYPEFIWDYAGN